MYYTGVFTGDVGNRGYGLIYTKGTRSLGNDCLHNGKDNPVAAWTSKLNVSCPKAIEGAGRSLESLLFSHWKVKETGGQQRTATEAGDSLRKQTGNTASLPAPPPMCLPIGASHWKIPPLWETLTHLLNPFWKCRHRREPRHVSSD